MTPGLDKELNAALTANLRHKSYILALLFGIIFIIQVIALCFFFLSTDVFQRFQNPAVVAFGPLFLLIALVSEGYAVRYIDRLTRSGQTISKRFVYFVTFIEMSFPSFVLVLAGVYALSANLVTPAELLSSPPMIIYFIMIILSSLMLDLRLCLFAGLVAGIEYALISVYFVRHYSASGAIELPNQLVKCVFIILSGLFAGFVSRKIREAVVSSLNSKNDLIHNLDTMVNEKTAEVRKQKEEIEEKNKDITASITYARRIQEAIFPPLSIFRECFSDCFVLYLPKDIVSGDFYWIERSGNKILVAAVDCTGHGVPGAFMSIVGHDLLSKAVFEKKLALPSAILDSMNAELSRTLRQDKDDRGVKDGMDLALCAFDMAAMKLEYAGANNPLWLLREGSIVELKADKLPVGAHHGSKGLFATQTVDLKKDDRVFLFSDGYADQFGGPKGKKFKYKPLQDLLISTASGTMDEQYSALKRTHLEWKGQLEQIDDILIIGIRI
jgi:serine phosphatase RsbU (regulator of sigma subunit)